MTDLGFLFMAGDRLLELLNRVSEGEDPDMVFAEVWANAEHQTKDDWDDEDDRDDG